MNLFSQDSFEYISFMKALDSEHFGNFHEYMCHRYWHLFFEHFGSAIESAKTVSIAMNDIPSLFVQLEMFDRLQYLRQRYDFYVMNRETQ